MKRLAWFSEGWFAPPRGGKTLRMAGRAVYLAENADSLNAVVYLDPPGDWDPAWGGRIFKSWGEVVDNETIPPLTVCQFGVDEMDDYREAIDAVIDIGDCALVVDECHLFANVRGKPMPELVRIATMGRHLPNRHGENRQTCLIVGSQRPNDIHVQVRDAIRDVYVGRFRGRAVKSWIRDEIDEAALDKMQMLPDFAFLQVAPKISRDMPRGSRLLLPKK
jgi:hypothetical protein